MKDLEGIKREQERRKEPAPEDNPVAWTIVFADLIWGLLDLGSGLGVWYLTDYFYYGALVFAAGIIPLLLWQRMIVQPYANATQRKHARQGEGLAIGSVIVVAAFIGFVRFVVDGVYVEAALAVSLVLIAARHGFLARKYYFADEGIINKQNEAQMIADAQKMVKEYEIARRVLEAQEDAAKERRSLEGEYSPELVSRMLGEKDNRPN